MDGAYTLSGVKGIAEFQFMDGHLWSAGVEWEIAEGGDKIFDEAVKKTSEAFGKETESVIDKKIENPLNPDSETTYTNTVYNWQRKSDDGNTTKASLVALKADGVITSINFGAAEFPIKY